MERVYELANVIISLSNCSYHQISNQIKELLASADCRELAHAQQRVLEAGLDIDELFTIWQQNKQILPDQVAKMRRELPDNHIIQRILAEHDMMLCFIADLHEVNTQIQQLEYATSSNTYVRKLEHVASHLSSAAQHPEREDEVIFPELARRGFPGPAEIITMQHRQLSTRLAELQQLVWMVESISFEEFKANLQNLAEYVVPVMRRHIFLENNLVLPLAMELLDDVQTWKRIKEVCDEIGYCGYGAK